EASLAETRRSAREAAERLSQLERDEKGLNDRIAALERARREAEARGAATAAASITTADLGQLEWPVDGKIVYQFGTAVGPNNTRIPWHGIGIAAPEGTPVRAIASGSVSLAGPLGTYLTSVLLDHGGGYYSFYGYLSDPAAVAKGERGVEVQLASLAAGRLVRLLKDEGDTVRQGDTLAVLEQPGLDALISQRRAQAKAAGLRTAEVAAAQADSARAANDLARAEPLRRQNIVSQQQYEALKAAATAAAARLAAMRAAPSESVAAGAALAVTLSTRDQLTVLARDDGVI